MEEEKKEAKQKPGKGRQKPGEKNAVVSKLQNFWINISSEFKKIIWPKRDELAKQTLIVIIICAIFGAVIFGMDSAFGAVLKLVAGTI